MTIDERIRWATALHDRLATAVRCLECGAGTGKFCRDADGNPTAHQRRLRTYEMAVCDGTFSLPPMTHP